MRKFSKIKNLMRKLSQVRIHRLVSKSIKRAELGQTVSLIIISPASRATGNVLAAQTFPGPCPKT
jgi:hypothetical protein